MPFDPFRLLLAALESLWLIALAALVVGAMGASYAWARLGDTYKAPVRLLKESAPDSWTDDRAGPYAPRPLGAEALKIIADSTEVFDRAAERLEPPVGGASVRHHVTFEEITGQDLFEVMGLSKADSDEARRYAVAYAEALVELVTERRRGEAAAASAQFAAHLEEKRNAARRISKELLEVTSKGGLFDTGGQTTSRLQEVRTLRVKEQEAVGRFERAKAAVTVYLKQSWTGPLRAEVERMKRERGSSDSQVLAREAQLDEIEGQVEALTSVDGGDAVLRSLAARLPSVVYKGLMRLREDLKVAKADLDAATALLLEAEAKVDELPGKVLTVSDLQTNLREKLAASVLVETRMKDAEFYSQTPPPPLQILHSATLDEIEHRSALSKAVLLGSAGAFGGAFLMLGLVLAIELFRRSLRTPLQAAIATAAVPKLTYSRAGRKHGGNDLRDFWLRSIGKYLPDQRRFLFPVVGEASGEEGFWYDLLHSLEESPYPIVFVDYGSHPLDRERLGFPASGPGGDSNVLLIDPDEVGLEKIEELCAKLPERHVLLIRWEQEPNTVLVDLCRYVDRYYFVTSGKDASRADVEALSGIYRDLLGEADGVILAERRRPGRARRIIASIENWFIASRRPPQRDNLLASELEGAF